MKQMNQRNKMTDTNKVFLVGTVKFQPKIEKKISKAGKPFSICKLAIEVITEIKTKDGIKGEKLFIDVVCFGQEAEKVGSRLNVGDSITVEGRLKLESWTDKNGQERFKHVIQPESITYPEIVEAEPDFTPSPKPQTTYPQRQVAKPQHPRIQTDEFNDDGLPF